MTIFERKTYRHEELPARLASILATIRSVYEPERIILYGSAAQGGDWHDLDLVVIADTKDGFFERLQHVRHGLAAIEHVASDILVYTPDEVERAAEENRFFLIEEVLRKGKVVYKRSSTARPDIGALLRRPRPAMRQLDAQDWFRNAEDDLRWARLGFEGELYARACFACHQAMEKALKALLLARTGRYPRTHSLPDLLSLCVREEDQLAGLQGACESLDGYYVATRYSSVEDSLSFDRNKADEAIRLAGSAITAIRPLITAGAP